MKTTREVPRTARLTPVERGKKILALLKADGWTASSAAREADITYKTMRRILDGLTVTIQAPTVDRFVDRLKLPRELLVG